jgi:transposase-like protein
MARGIPVIPEIRELIINRVKIGENLDIVAREFSIYPNTIRKWLAQEGVSSLGGSSCNSSGTSATGSTRNGKSTALLLAKAQREKQDLLTIIGELIVQLKGQSKKKGGRTGSDI